MLSIRGAFILSLLGIHGYLSAAGANSCANMTVIGTYDGSGLREYEAGNEFAIRATGTFRIEGEADEAKQPDFNLATVACEKHSFYGGKVSIQCNVAKAVVWAESGKPDTDKPNCSLDVDSSTYSMKELQKGILVGTEESTSCWNATLTINRNMKRVYLSFTRTEYADNYEKKFKPGFCGAQPRTEVLMNCTAWPRMRKQDQTPPRYCDFSSSSDK
jgi:hypothetical protein